LAYPPLQKKQNKSKKTKVKYRPIMGEVSILLWK